MDRKALIGRWRITPDSSGKRGDYAMEFTGQGELVYTDFNEQGKIYSRSLLTYRIEGSILVTDQPSNPREDRMFMWFEGNNLILIDDGMIKAFTREDDPSDPEAYLLAISGSAIQHALDTADDDGPFMPFLLTDSEEGRTLVRFIANTPQEAQQHARHFILSKKDALTACSFAYDGYVTIDGKRSDAVIVEASQQGMDHGLLLAQPYAIQSNKAVRIDRFAIQTAESWFQGVA